MLPQSGAAQHIETILLEPSVPLTLYEFADVFGNRCHRTVIPAGPFSLRSTIIADCPDRIDVDPQATFVPMQEVPDDILQFLLPSRYCESDLLGDKAREIAGTSATAYAQVESIRQWINHRFEYVYGITNSSTSALGVIASCRGVCRDYAHAGMALCRSLNIPARMVVGYLYGLYPYGPCMPGLKPLLAAAGLPLTPPNGTIWRQDRDRLWQRRRRCGYCHVFYRS